MSENFVHGQEERVGIRRLSKCKPMIDKALEQNVKSDVTLPRKFHRLLKGIGLSAAKLFSLILEKSGRESDKTFILISIGECAKETDILSQNIRKPLLELVETNRIVIGKKITDQFAGEFVVVVPCVLKKENHNKVISILSQITTVPLEEIKDSFYKCISVANAFEIGE